MRKKKVEKLKYSVHNDKQKLKTIKVTQRTKK
jgi:hypothetical protein